VGAKGPKQLKEEDHHADRRNKKQQSGISMDVKAETMEKEPSREKGLADESALTRVMGLAIGGIGFFLIALKLLNPY
jgi:hypothetical protein